jgi:hypothetical protein
MMNTEDCRFCEPPKRHVGCHITCPIYLAKCEKRKKMNENRAKYYEDNKAQFESMQRFKKR